MMNFQIIALVVALLFPAYPVLAAQTQAPAAKAACCQMQGDHAGHGDAKAEGASCCMDKGDACKNCKDGNCADCCKDGACKDCCKEGCCKDEKCAGCGSGEMACCKKDAPKR
jgi:hypothetical protein